MKKVLAFTLALAMLLGCVSIATADEAPVKLTIMIRHIGFDTDDVNIISEEINRRLNIDVEWILAPSQEYGTQCSNIIIGGDYPDAMEYACTSYPLDIQQMAEDGIIIPLDDLLAEYGQDILAARDEDYLWYTAEDGHIYSISCRRQEMSNNVYQIRQDWLDKLGLQVPTTVDELHDVLVAFRDNAATLVGEGNTLIPWGFVQGNNSSGLEGLIYGAYGFISGWNDVDGHATYYVNHPNFKEALRTIREWQQEGLLDPEWPIMNREQNLEKWYGNTYGAWMNYLDNTERLPGGYLDQFLTMNPEAELSFIMPVSSEYGEGLMTNSTTWNQMVIFSDTTEEQRIALMKLFNYVISPEGSDLVEMGIEGEHWEEVGDTGRANFFYMNNSSAEQHAELGYYSFNWFMKRNYFPRWNSEAFLSVGQAYANYLAFPCIITTTPAQLEYGTTLSDVLKTRTQLILDGDLDFDTVFDDMVRRWNDYGGAEWTAEMDAAYQAQKALRGE